MRSSGARTQTHATTYTAAAIKLASEWLVCFVSIISYSGLALHLLLICVYGLRLLLASVVTSARGEATDTIIAEGGGGNGPVAYIGPIIAFAWTLPVSLLAIVSNFSGIVDITTAPLVADLLLGTWRLCAVLSAVLMLTALPAFMAASPSRRRYHDYRLLLPWYLLFLPAIAASSAASELTLVLPAARASGVLAAGYALWGGSVIPALAFAVLYIKQHMAIRRHDGNGNDNNNGNGNGTLGNSTATAEDGGLGNDSVALSDLKQYLEPLAPLSQLALGIMSLGVQGRRVWSDSVGATTAPLLLGELSMAAGAILGLIFWASSAAWFLHAHLLAALAISTRSAHHYQQRHSGYSALFTSLSPRATCVGKLCLEATSTCHPIYPVASLAIASATLARIWSSTTLLMLTQALLVYTSILISILTARKLVWEQTAGLCVQLRLLHKRLADGGRRRRGGHQAVDNEGRLLVEPHAASARGGYSLVGDSDSGNSADTHTIGAATASAIYGSM
ncbi:hypothetical protein GGI07_005249 [Coemansia sp. Benny D115]|nr:hypothetical protein GGI07_005249 [Coemansia sp. Benny D115]